MVHSRNVFPRTSVGFIKAEAIKGREYSLPSSTERGEGRRLEGTPSFMKRKRQKHLRGKLPTDVSGNKAAERYVILPGPGASISGWNALAPKWQTA